MKAKRNPKLTQQSILTAAKREFATYGVGAARVDRIAARAGANKRMLYHYFGGKADLYLAVIEETYADIRRAEMLLDIDHHDPIEGLRRFVLFTWEYYIENPEFLSLLNTENLQKAKFVKRSKKIASLQSPLMSTLSRLLNRGFTSGRFRRNPDPLQLYITIAALGFFYLSNRHTLSAIFKCDLMDRESLAARGEHIVAVVLGYLTSDQIDDA